MRVPLVSLLTVIISLTSHTTISNAFNQPAARAAAIHHAAFIQTRFTKNPKAPSPSSSSHATISMSSSNDESSSSSPAVDMSDVGIILLAGGTGSRMKATMPKQFLTLRGIPILQHSLNLFLDTLPSHLSSSSTSSGPSPHVILVMDPQYQPEYQHLVDKYAGRLTFANPGVERQGSVQNGLSKLIATAPSSCTYVAVHDSARPLVTIDEICHVVSDAKTYGAAVLGVPCKATIKESADGSFVERTIPRSRLWEVHTPQVIAIETLERGFRKVEEEGLEVTDDVSVVEALGERVKLTRGEYTNLKITTPEDMDVADAILAEREGATKGVVGV